MTVHSVSHWQSDPTGNQESDALHSGSSNVSAAAEELWGYKQLKSIMDMSIIITIQHYLLMA